MSLVEGFSKKNKQEKRQWINNTYFSDEDNALALFSSYDNPDDDLQKLHDEFTENAIGNYYLPFSVAPNFKINNKWYTVPMVTEESSVVAAASKAAKFWAKRGGFHSKVISMEKVGQIHLMFDGNPTELFEFFEDIKPELIQSIEPLSQNMKKRGGGLCSIHLKNKTQQLKHYYQVHCTFETLDAMGANFINSCLEQMAKVLIQRSKERKLSGRLNHIMSILSNYVPHCIVISKVKCPVSALETADLSAEEYAQKFVQAVQIANTEVHRAVTHNKGIMNGIDAVVIATGNDFRAVEAGAHAYACRNGQYSSLSSASLNGNIFEFSLEIPLSLGTIGGLTRLHPMVKMALQILKHPSAKELMQIAASVGLAQNFAAINSLITSGIQKGHMKMHLTNILNQYGATENEKKHIITYFADKTVSYEAVAHQLQLLRQSHGK